MRRFALLAMIAALCLALASCAAGVGGAHGAVAAAAGTTLRAPATTTATARIGPGRTSCPTTRPPQPPFVPPKPYRATPPPLYGGMVWYGSDELWTWLHPDGILELARDGDGLFDKSFWWRAGFDPMTETRPNLTLTARRLDATGPAIAASDGDATNGWRDDDDIGAFMLTGIRLPAAGCWEITGHYGDTALAFVAWVT